MDRSEFDKIRSSIKEPNREAVEHNLTLLYRLMDWDEFDYVVYVQSPTNFIGRGICHHDYWWRHSEGVQKKRRKLREKVGKLENDIWTEFLPSSLRMTEYNMASRYARVKDTPELEPVWKNILRETLNFAPKTKVPVVLEKPLEIHTDDRGRPHNINGPAIIWRDGTRNYFFDGLFVSKRFVENEPTVAYINRQWNQERKRVLIERYGHEKYLNDSGAKLIHETELGKLWMIPDRTAAWNSNGEDQVFVEVVNSTPEPDGSFHRYFLRVPPDITRVKTAIAWTFKKRNNSYNPVAES